jgi:hypothetical protein
MYVRTNSTPRGFGSGTSRGLNEPLSLSSLSSSIVNMNRMGDGVVMSGGQSARNHRVAVGVVNRLAQQVNLPPAVIVISPEPVPASVVVCINLLLLPCYL